MDEIPYERRNSKLPQKAACARAEDRTPEALAVFGGRGFPVFLYDHVVVARQSANDASPEQRLLQNLPPFLNRTARK